MFTISVELLHGTFRADPDGTANTGRLVRGEWPPSPARLFAALVAADGTRDQTRVTDGSELLWLEALPPPIIHAHRQAWHQTQQRRFVVIAERAKRTHQEYVARSGALHRPGVRVSPRNPRVVYLWEKKAPPETFESIRLRAARVGYLGASDSPVRLRVATELPPDPPGDVFGPDSDGKLRVNVPRPGATDLLDRMFDAWRVRGASVARSQFPALTRSARYRPPDSQPDADHGVVVAWLRLRPAVSGRRVSRLTSLFKEAVLSHHQRIHGEPPAVLHGHGFERTGYDLARYLALPDVGFSRSRGRIHGLALWLPPDTDEVTQVKARDAVFAVQVLKGSGVDVAVLPREEEPRPLGSQSAAMAATVAGVGDCVSRRSRATWQGAPAGRRSVVPARRPAGAGFVPRVAFAARFRRGGLDAGGSQSFWSPRAPVLPRRDPFCGGRFRGRWSSVPVGSAGSACAYLSMTEKPDVAERRAAGQIGRGLPALPTFAEFYRAINGREPFPWQARLAGLVAEEERWKSEIGVPTGLGKTACLDIAVWWLASQAGARPLPSHCTDANLVGGQPSPAGRLDRGSCAAGGRLSAGPGSDRARQRRSAGGGEGRGAASFVLGRRQCGPVGRHQPARGRRLALAHRRGTPYHRSLHSANVRVASAVSRLRFASAISRCCDGRDRQPRAPRRGASRPTSEVPDPGACRMPSKREGVSRWRTCAAATRGAHRHG